MVASLYPVSTPSESVVINRAGDPLGGVSDYLSEPMASAISDIEVQELVDDDIERILVKVTAGRMSLVATKVELGLIDREESGFVEHQRSEEAVVLIPGLSGVESYDVLDNQQNDEIDEKARAVMGLRLYCGLNIAHLALGQRMKADNFFKVKYRKVFGIKEQGVADRIDTFSEHTPADLRARLGIHSRYSGARFAAGLVFGTIFDNDNDRTAANRLLTIRYEEELAQSNVYINKAIQLLRVNEHSLPPDMIPITAQGYLQPLEPVTVNRLLSGTLGAVS